MTAIWSGAREGWSAGTDRGEVGHGLSVQRCARGCRDVRFVRHRLPDYRGVDVLVRARVSRSKKYAHWHVS